MLPQQVWEEGNTQTHDQPQTSGTALGEPSKPLFPSKFRHCRPVLFIPQKKVYGWPTESHLRDSYLSTTDKNRSSGD